ncbi:hypothetical protein [Jannaschia seohaensis]|uniref:Uncharacterized protein n=1 Tax=Jannaschia seohaensis TaxID=475081 RepID=A0A2Y9A9A2_9RHOB|nr:hypothetical protein [Jannaschia seohaensis]PWJ22509.1 hypothetical protein BCF38_101923 [Jannaschia seohaensis]SSA38787.1 hypothetical protein SAMN05421539_101923 [Jannaschia seohaensis]
MEPLLDAVSVFAACTDLSIDVVMGEKYPTLTIRQGPGSYLCASAALTAAPYVAAGVALLSVVSILRRSRLRRRYR